MLSSSQHWESDIVDIESATPSDLNKTSHTHTVTVIMSLLDLNSVVMDFRCFAEKRQ